MHDVFLHSVDAVVLVLTAIVRPLEVGCRRNAVQLLPAVVLQVDDGHNVGVLVDDEHLCTVAVNKLVAGSQLLDHVLYDGELDIIHVSSLLRNRWPMPGWAR